MTKIVSFAANDFCGLEISGTPPWVEGRCLPTDIHAERRAEVSSEDAALPFADFMSAYGVGYAGKTTFVASEVAWNSLLKGRFGVVALSNVADLPAGYRLVLVAAKLDVIDYERSVEMIPGVFEGLHVHDIADELVDESVFSLVGANQTWLLCGDRWADRYSEEGFTGLSFEIAKVG